MGKKGVSGITSVGLKSIDIIENAKSEGSSPFFSNIEGDESPGSKWD